MILIIGNDRDGTDKVYDFINSESDQRVVKYDARSCLDTDFITISFEDNEMTLNVKNANEVISSEEIDKVWFWKPILPKGLRSVEPHEDAVYIHRQFIALWRAIPFILRDAKMFNGYIESLIAENKPYQLSLASDLGFKIPRTLMTSDPESLEKMWESSDDELIIKTLSSTLSDKHVLFAHKLDESLYEQRDRIRSSPSIFQQLVDKVYDMRVTIVGDLVFAVKVVTEKKLDWRSGKMDLEVINLPDEIAQMCVQLVKSLKLNYGSIDLSLDKKGNYYFLEINPNGQYRFVEEKTSLPISAAIAQYIISM
ncbi:MAG: hypothetical protein ACKKL5_00100 [Candidatus Komeilibacteria bacterium]